MYPSCARSQSSAEAGNAGSDEVLAELARGHAVGPAGLSAANRFGLTTQVPRTPEYAVCGWNGRPIDRLRTVRRSAARARDAARLNETEVARVRARLRYLLERAELDGLAAAVPAGSKPASDRDALRVLGVVA